MTDGWQGSMRKPGKAPAKGEDTPAGESGPSKPVDWDSCPVIALGKRNGRYYFFAPSGEEREIHYRQLYKREGLEDLFEGQIGWLIEYFGNGDGGMNVMRAARALLRECVAAGQWDDSIQRRGPGVWRDADKLIVHCGNEVLIDGESWRAGFRLGDALYSLAPKLPPPAREPATARDGNFIRQAIGLWNFEDDKAPDIVTGFIGLALLGAAPDWRVHIFLRAPYGSGKTWLCELVAKATGARPPTNNITPAFIYQGLTGEARAIVIDEAESSDRDDRIGEVIKIIRLMSGRDGGNIGRGGADGRSQRFSVTGSAFMAAILHPDLQPQDRSRFAVLKLRPLATGQAAIGRQERALKALAFAGEIAPALRARAVAGWHRFLDTVQIYRAAALSENAEARSADTIAALLAGRDLLLRDDLPSASEADGDIAALDHLLVRDSDRAVDGEGDQCLVRLLSSPVETWGGGERMTIGEKVMDARAPGAHRNEINKILGRVGVKLKFEMKDGQAVLLAMLVARRHHGLEKIFAGTRWAGGVWRQALEDLPGAGPWEQPVNFGGAPCTRCTAIPPHCLPEPEDGKARAKPEDAPVDPADLGAGE